MSRREIFSAVAQQLERAILRGELPADLPAERDLALLFHVSRPTIRKALHILRTHHPEIHAEKQQPTPVASLAYIGETNTHFYQDLFIAIAQCAQAQGFRITSTSSDNSLSLLAAERAVLQGANAVICTTERLAAISDQLSALPPTVPVVIVDLLRTAVERPSRCIWGDRRAAAVIAVNHAVALGHTHIVCVVDPSATRDGPTAPASTLVEFGFRSAMQTHGLMTLATVELTADFVLTDLLRQGCTAVICDMDFTATRIYAAMHVHGLSIPRDLSVIGIGDTPWSRSLSPALTTIDFRPREIAAYAVAACRMGTPQQAEAIFVEPRLMRRDSVCELADSAS